MPSAPNDVLIGELIADRYRIETRIGRGPSSHVYRAQDLRHHSLVAIKVMRREDADRLAVAERFRREATVIARLTSPYTVRLFDSGALETGELYLIFEYLEGDSLSLLFERQGRLRVERVVPLMRDVCESLAEAHGKDIVHCDLKPQNLFVQRAADFEHAKVLDFGVARFRGQGPASSARMPSPIYLAPERTRGEAATPAGDLYSLGAVLYECLAGRPPFLAGEAETLVRMHQREEPAPVSRSLESGPIADQLADVVHAMLAKEPGRRPSAAVARGELDSIHGKIAREQTSRVMVERKPRRWSLTRLFRP